MPKYHIIYLGETYKSDSTINMSIIENYKVLYYLCVFMISMI